MSPSPPMESIPQQLGGLILQGLFGDNANDE